jgi:hypothetical protein
MATSTRPLHREVIGSSTTNSTAGSQHTQTVDARFLWSYAQEEALLALSDRAADGTHRLITDPERRAKRIAARYADLYFRSAEKSQGQVQLYWVGLAAFVVKDIVEAFRYAREGVLNAGWANLQRTSTASSAVSSAFTDASPYEHAVRVYAALAKGNIWLFMDIYPWMWFFLEYGLNRDGTLNAARLNSHVGERNSANFQTQSRQAVQELPFGANWLGRLRTRVAADPVYAEGLKFFNTRPVWGGMGSGYGQHVANALQAHRYVKQHVQDYDQGYRVPPAKYWNKFGEAFYVMDEERRELNRVAADAAGLARLQRVARFTATKDIRDTYAKLIEEFNVVGDAGKFARQKQELNLIATQEQINILQPLIYEDAKLISTMNINHTISRYLGEFFTPKYKVVYSAQPSNNDSNLQTVFDDPSGVLDYFKGPSLSLPNPEDRMKYVAQIARDFNRLMGARRAYMEAELQKIRGWLNA